MSEDPEKIVEKFFSEELGEDEKAGPGRPSKEDEKAREEREALKELLPQVMPLLGEAIRTPWDLWQERTEDRIRNTYKLRVRCDFLALTETESHRVAAGVLPVLSKYIGPYMLKHGPEILALLAVCAVTVPKLLTLRKLERNIADQIRSGSVRGSKPEALPEKPAADHQEGKAERGSSDSAKPEDARPPAQAPKKKGRPPGRPKKK